MRPVYALVLDFDGDRLEELRGGANGWLAAKYAEYDGQLPSEGTTTLREGHDLRVETLRSEEGQLYHLTLEHPDRRVPIRRWITNVTLASDGSETECAVTISTRAMGAGLMPPRPDQIRTPRYIRDVAVKLSPRVGREPLALEPLRASAEDVGTLVDILTMPSRRLPIVMVSPLGNRGLLADPQELHKRLLGYARVIELDNAAAYGLSDAVSKELSCFDGGVRIYWPGFSLDDDRYHHKLYLKWEIREIKDRGRRLADVLFGRLLSASIAQFQGGRLARSIRRAEQTAQRREFDALRERIAERDSLGAEEQAAVDALLEDAARRMTEAQEERDSLELRVLEQDETIERLTRELDQAQANMRAMAGFVEGAEEDTRDQEAASHAAPIVILSDVALDAYEAHPERQNRFDHILMLLSDPDHRSSNMAANGNGGGFVAPRGNSDERAFFFLRDGVVHVCELFPHHQDSLATRYNALRNDGLDENEYSGFAPLPSTSLDN